jgi:hypothetical protein
MLILQASAVLFAADLVSGFVHWAEDTFFTESTPVIGPSVIAPNVEHHERPAAMSARATGTATDSSSPSPRPSSQGPPPSAF